MKTILIFISLFLVKITYAQWETAYYVDNKGKETTESYKYIDILGVFSDEKINDGKCAFFVVHDEKAENYNISIYPFDGVKKERWKKNTFQHVWLTTPSGEEVQLNTFCYKKGLVLFSDEDYLAFKQSITEIGLYSLHLNLEGKDQGKEYSFQFTIYEPWVNSLPFL